jgi:hypothetical protein
MNQAEVTTTSHASRLSDSGLTRDAARVGRAIGLETAAMVVNLDW